MSLLNLIITAMLGEAIWETLKMVWQNGKLSIDRIGALIIGIFLSLTTGLDLLELSGIPVNIPYAGMVLTGILISRGSNFVHDLLDNISKNKGTVNK